VKLVGTTSNRSAIGARVVVEAGDLTQVRAVKGGGGYQSQSDFRLHFGMGQNSVVKKLSIKWPSGTTQVLENVSTGQILTIEEEKN